MDARSKKPESAAPLTPALSTRIWLRGLDLNQRPSGYEPDELPDCSTPREHLIGVPFDRQIGNRARRERTATISPMSPLVGLTFSTPARAPGGPKVSSNLAPATMGSCCESAANPFLLPRCRVSPPSHIPFSSVSESRCFYMELATTLRRGYSSSTTKTSAGGRHVAVRGYSYMKIIQMSWTAVFSRRAAP